MKGLQTIQVEKLILIYCKHSVESGHIPLEAVDYERIGTGYRKNTMNRKLSKALLIKELKPTLNKQEKFVPLKLFNSNCLLT